MQKRLGNRLWVGGGQCRCCGSFLDPQLEDAETCSTSEATRGHCVCVHAVVCGMKLADPGTTTEPRGLTASQSRPAVFSPPLLSPDAVRPWMCVCSPPLQRQLAETPHERHLIANSRVVGLRQQNIHHCPLIWIADGRPLPAVTRTPLYAADIASSRNGQQMSAKSLQRRWMHEIQIALLRRRAAMARAVLPNPSARAEWLFACVIVGARHHWRHVSLLTVDLAVDYGFWLPRQSFIHVASSADPLGLRALFERTFQ